MSAALAPAPDLAALADAANREHQLAIQAGTAAVEHAIKAGLALLEAKAQLEHGEWMPWLHDNFAYTVGAARNYMRLARYQDRVREANPAGIGAAMRMLWGEGDSRHVPGRREEVHRLWATGEYPTKSALAEELGVSLQLVCRYLNPDTDRRARQRARELTRAGRRELDRKHRDATVKKQGGSVAAAYALVRRALKVLEAAHEEASEREVRLALSSAMNSLYGAEDSIVKASKRS